MTCMALNTGADKAYDTEHFINELLGPFHARRWTVYCFQGLLSTPRKGKSHGFDNSSAGRRERHPDLESRACKISGTRRKTDASAASGADYGHTLLRALCRQRSGDDHARTTEDAVPDIRLHSCSGKLARGVRVAVCGGTCFLEATNSSPRIA
jgi:hypothetical protein